MGKKIRCELKNSWSVDRNGRISSNEQIRRFRARFVELIKTTRLKRYFICHARNYRMVVLHHSQATVRKRIQVDNGRTSQTR